MEQFSCFKTNQNENGDINVCGEIITIGLQNVGKNWAWTEMVQKYYVGARTVGEVTKFKPMTD